ncbi:MAG: M20/M25/M40 family metallo-hydrolase [Clostridia bacterium]|nr:M20/M25/M40 family metallo-hydrolase [Clostridia bacterium]
MIDYLQIKDYISKNKNEIVNTLIELIKIPSISDTPYVKELCEHLKKLYSENDLIIEEGKEYLLAHCGNGIRTIGLFCHGDVVPASNDWTACKPFDPVVIGDNLFGRGSIDNKSAIAMSLFVVKMLKELNIPLKSKLTTFVGFSEETSMCDIKEYAKSNTPPDFSLVLDAGFPVYLGDKGILWLNCQKKERFENLISLNGGDAVNIILKTAEARVKYSLSLYEELKENKTLDISKEGSEILIKAEGISNHGAMPEGSLNAGFIILDALLNANSFSTHDKEILKPIASLLSEYYGKELDICSSDECFGKTTCTNGIISIQNGEIYFTLDIRYGSTYTHQGLLDKIESYMYKLGYEIKVIKDGEPKAESIDNKYVIACMNTYREHTKNYECKPRINAGGTYSRYLSNAIETGTTTKYDSCSLPAGHGQAHQPDEHISIEGLLEATEIITKMILSCDDIE